MLDEYTKNRAQQPKVKKGDLVLAKITGYPWWPAIVSQITESDMEICRVDFLCDLSHAYLPMKKIVLYGEGRELLDNVKKTNKQLNQAIESAQKQFCSSQKGVVLKGELLRCFVDQSQQQNQFTQKSTTTKIRKQLNKHQEISSEEHNIIPVKTPYSQKKQKTMEKQLIIQQLLTRYNLITIPSISTNKKPKTQANTMIKKIKNNKILIIRKIYNFLRKKMNNVEARRISIELNEQVMQSQNKWLFLSNLLRWIRASDEEIVQKYYDRWWEWGKSQQKCSDMTNYQ